MTLFKKSASVVGVASLTAENAMVIYDLLKTKDANRIFLEDNIPTEHTVQVEKEIQQMESEMVSKMSGTFATVEAKPAELDKNGQETKAAVEAVYFAPTTEAALVSSMSSDLITVATLVIDVRAWSDGNPDQEPTWAVYKASFNQ